MMRFWLAIAGLGGLASIVAGAVAAHAELDPHDILLLQNGALYGMVHATVLVALIGFSQGREPRRGAAVFAGWCFSGGIVLFSLAQFAQVLTEFRGFALGVPFGGTLLILGWASLLILAFRRR
jgi:uncharacterized membrane protein YgdD (TMEM256/DUF423 family)